MTYLVATDLNEEFDVIEGMFDNMEDALCAYMVLDENGVSVVIYEEN